MATVVPNVVLVDQPSGLTFIPQVHVLYDDEQVPEVLRTHAVLEIEIGSDGKIQNLRPVIEEVQIVSSQAITTSDNVMNLVIQGCFPARHALPGLIDRRLPPAFEEQCNHFMEREKAAHALLSELAGNLMDGISLTGKIANLVNHTPLMQTLQSSSKQADNPRSRSPSLRTGHPTKAHTDHTSPHRNEENNPRKPTPSSAHESPPDGSELPSTSEAMPKDNTKTPSSLPYSSSSPFSDPAQTLPSEAHHRHSASYTSPPVAHPQQRQMQDRPRTLFIAQPSPRRPAFPLESMSPQASEADIRSVQPPASQTPGRTVPRSFPYKVDSGVSPQTHTKKISMEGGVSPYGVSIMSASPPLQLQLDSIVNTTVDSFRFQMENLANMYLRPPSFSHSPQPTSGSPNRDVKAHLSTRSPPFMIHESSSPPLSEPMQRRTM